MLFVGSLPPGAGSGDGGGGEVLGVDPGRGRRPQPGLRPGLRGAEPLRGGGRGQGQGRPGTGQHRLCNSYSQGEYKHIKNPVQIPWFFATDSLFVQSIKQGMQ